MEQPDSPRDMLGRQQLTTVAEARRLLLEAIQGIVGQTETVQLDEAFDRISAADIIAGEDLPCADRSTMDGYALIAADTFGASQSLPAYIAVTGEVDMGAVPEGAVSRGTCLKIPTGGLLPAGADAVVMHEHTVPVDDDLIEVVKSVGSGTNVIKVGDDIRAGEVAVAAGHRLRPQDLGLLAGLGIESVTVYEQLTVGIISTGDEIIDRTAPLSPGKTRNINSLTLYGQIRRCGARVKDYGIVDDEEGPFFAAVERAVAENDLVLFSGGSSVGIRDLGEQAITRAGEPGILVHGVALKPGKPIIIGLAGTTPLFGLPGHPVSALVCFDLFVRPAIASLAGIRDFDRLPRATVRARLTRNINSAAGRLDLIRVRLAEEHGTLLAQPVLGRSGAISTLARADGYFLIAEPTQGCNENDVVEVCLYE